MNQSELSLNQCLNQCGVDWTSLVQQAPAAVDWTDWCFITSFFVWTQVPGKLQLDLFARWQCVSRTARLTYTGPPSLDPRSKHAVISIFVKISYLYLFQQTPQSDRVLWVYWLCVRYRFMKTCKKHVSLCYIVKLFWGFVVTGTGYHNLWVIGR